jgi:TolA-binding protein
MPRSSRFTAVVSIGLAVTLLAPTSASAQSDTEISEITELERRRDELTVTIAELETQVEELTERVDSLDEAIRQSELAVELLADDFERLVDARREPERTRIEVAIAGYMVGDPRRNALLDEFDAIEGADEPERRRQFYSAVMDDAVRRLAEIDEQLRGLAGQVDEARSATSDLEAQKQEAAAQREELGGQMTQLALELDEVLSDIELLRSLENKAILTGLPTLSDPTLPALAVKIDNVGSALPQAGINQADVVWEEAVEGGFSRLAAVFHSEAPSVVGPVRSMRTSDVDLLEQLNHPLFANSGGNRVTGNLVAGSELINIGAAGFADAYYRDTSRRRPANLFANTSSLWAVGASEDAREIGTPGQPVPLWPYREPDDPLHPAATPASGVDIDFGSTQVSYEWNGTGWARSQNGVAHVDTAGVQVAPTNLIVQFTPYTPSAADPNSPHAITVGSREVWIFMNGTVIVATWRRDESTDPVQFVDGNGQPIPLEPGRTWIALARLDSATLR